jgi:spore germination protein KC
MKTWIAVAKGSANDFLTASAGTSSIPGQSLGDIFGYQKFTGLGLPSNLLKVYGNFTSENTNLLIASLSFNEAVTQADLTKRADNTREQIQIAGMAVFDQKRMLGYLSEDETHGLAWLLGHNPNTVISIPHPENSSKSVAIEIENVKVKIDSELNQDTPEFSIKISGTGHIAEEDTMSDLSINEFKSQLEAQADNEIVSEVETSLNRVQKDFKSDVVGFGQIVHAQHKQEWNETIKKNWADIYPDVDVKVEADITIKSSTLNQIPLKNYKENANTYDQN